MTGNKYKNKIFHMRYYRAVEILDFKMSFWYRVLTVHDMECDSHDEHEYEYENEYELTGPQTSGEKFPRQL